jgi:methylated-DNA-protein-cysteine methyltransferase related protein
LPLTAGYGKKTIMSPRLPSPPVARDDNFSTRIKRVIGAIPAGKVATYGQIAALAGDHRSARQVVRILHACSQKEGLPWHRVVNSHATISLPLGSGYETQRRLLEAEGVTFGPDDRIDFDRYLWRPG